MLNPFFNTTGQLRPNQEQDLVHQWTKESIQMLGQEVYYIRRENVNHDKLFGEDTQSAFKVARVIEMFTMSTQGWEGQNDVFMNFGVVAKDQVLLQCATRRFEEVFPESPIPLEGDLIYFPNVFNMGLWEIKFVEDERQFYPLGALPSFKLRCELFDMSGESFETGIDLVDTRFAEERIPQTLEDLDSMFHDNKAIEDEAATFISPEQNIWGNF